MRNPANIICTKRLHGVVVCFGGVGLVSFRRAKYDSNIYQVTKHHPYPQQKCQNITYKGTEKTQVRYQKHPNATKYPKGKVDEFSMNGDAEARSDKCPENSTRHSSGKGYGTYPTEVFYN